MCPPILVPKELLWHTRCRWWGHPPHQFKQNTRDSKTIEMMEHSQPVSRDTPSNVRDNQLSENRFWDLVCGNHQGQRPRAPRKQAGHTSASDQCEITFENVLLCRSYPHRPFAATPKPRLVRTHSQRTKPRSAAAAIADAAFARNCGDDSLAAMHSSLK